MEIGHLNVVLGLLKVYWEEQNIHSSPRSLIEISNFSFGNNYRLPDELIKYFSVFNGMESLYPNDFDKEGFLFYPLHGLVTIDREFVDSEENDILVIANYMHKSWWYGLKILNGESYVIGIIPEKNKFKPIAGQLSEFLELYLNNSPRLYDYS